MCLVILVMIISSQAADSGAEDTLARLNEIETKALALSGECGKCRTVYVKDCTITMRKVVTPVTVRRCLSSMVGDDGQCIEGVRNKCSVR